MCSRQKIEAYRNYDLDHDKHEPISVSISSNLLDEPIFICIENPTELVIAFVDALEKLADKSKLIMNEKFQNITFTVNTRLAASNIREIEWSKQEEISSV